LARQTARPWWPAGAAFRRTDLALLGLVALVGVLAAFAVRFFEEIIDLSLAFGFETLPHRLGWGAYLVYPAVLGLAVAAVKRTVRKPDRIHSVPLVIVGMDKRGGRIHPASTLLKTLASILTLGAGGSLGREGPVVLLGGGLGSAVGQALRLKPEWLTTLVAAGSGAAIATAFNAPITGVFFAMEIVLIQFSTRSFALVAIACVTAAQVSGLVKGGPSFPIPAYQLNNPWEILLYIGLGVIITLLARIYVKVIYGSEAWGARIKAVPTWIKPAMGGIAFGAVAIFLPRTLGGGHHTITDALAGNLGIGMLALLLVGKLFTIGLTSGSGWPGGVFTPALYLGSMAGGIYGWGASALLPGIVPQPGAYAVVGMAAMIAGATHAPLTAMMLIFEVTGDYRIALPAMVACGISAVFSQRMDPYSIDTLHLPEHGILLPWQVRDLRHVPVSRVMSQDVHCVRADMLLRDVIRVMQTHRHGGYPVLDARGALVGMITLRDVREVPLESRLTTPVDKVMTRNVTVLTSDQTLADAATVMAHAGVGRLPVVDAADRDRLVGILSRSDVLRSYPTDMEPDETEELYMER
jgi:chloride channel protein, CIC family